MDPDDERPDFGPSGYLPERAAAQARKIILRAPLGIEWLVASVIGGLVLLGAGTVFLLTRGATEPAPPFEPLVPVVELEQRDTPLPMGELHVALIGARPRVFLAEQETIQFCVTSGHFEGSGGRVWAVTGRGFDDVPSLAQHPAVVFDDAVYVDRSRTIDSPPPTSATAEPACRPSTGR